MQETKQDSDYFLTCMFLSKYVTVGRKCCQNFSAIWPFFRQNNKGINLIGLPGFKKGKMAENLRKKKEICVFNDKTFTHVS